MAESRKRRIIRRAVTALAVVVLLAVGYVASWGAFFWWSGRTLFSESRVMELTATADQTVFAPLRLYAESDLPGGKAMYNFAARCFWHGAGGPGLPGESQETRAESQPAD